MAFSSAMAQQMPRRNALRETNNEFFKTEEARRIGNQVLAFQRCTGGWPKNIEMTQKMSNEELAQVLKEKSRRNDSTIDNGATTMQMIYLARLYRRQTMCATVTLSVWRWSIFWTVSMRMADGAILAGNARISGTYYF